MQPYQVIARKFRPQLLSEVCGQQHIVQTIRNSLQMQQTSHAYLFCGPRGTGKTTLARIFAKALNCQNLNENFEPCNACPSCSEINSGNSLDVIEIDGASNRGIDDIRQINETVGYAPSSGKYKIYIIDEVHMLTKEAFNALLKTLEEPPSSVKFFLATTEPHKVLPTIISRCLRFDLYRLPLETIQNQTKHISKQLGVSIEEQAIEIISKKAEGSLRDAQSILEQMLCYNKKQITKRDVVEVLGLVTDEILEQINQAFACKNLSLAFIIAEQIFAKGMNFTSFIESLLDYYKNVYLCQCGYNQDYEKLQSIYTKSQLERILQLLIESLQSKQFHKKMQLEVLLLSLLKISKEVSVDQLIQRIENLSTKAPSTASESTPVLEKEAIVESSAENASPAPEKEVSSPSMDLSHQSKIDTIVRFAAVELNGSVNT